MTTLEKLEKTVEKKTGEKASDIRARTIDETRKQLEKKGKKFKVRSEFPFIGRGNVLKDRLISSSEVDKLVNSAID